MRRRKWPWLSLAPSGRHAQRRGCAVGGKADVTTGPSLSAVDPKETFASLSVRASTPKYLTADTAGTNTIDGGK